MKTAKFETLPAHIQAAAFDAAAASANHYALRFGRERPENHVDGTTLLHADLFIQHAGAVVTGRNPLPIDKDAFAKQMKMLENYMQMAGLTKIEMPALDATEPPPTSIIVGAAEALFSGKGRSQMLG